MGNPRITVEIYPNSPLIEVACELRFPGEMSIECRRDQFHGAIKDTYSNILVPCAKPDKAMALEPYRFESHDSSVGVMLAINRLAYFSKKYAGHTVFIEEFLRVIDIFNDKFKVENLNRVGWRYVNVIPYEREVNLVPIGNFLDVNLKLPQSISGQPLDFTWLTRQKLKTGVVFLRIQSIKQNERDAILLDIDSEITGQLKMKAVKKHINDVHYSSRLIFEQMITIKYREFLRNKSL